ncbi:hypothetical protein KUCAC02_004427 [Chaenocephalus aceratus]|uniref:Uncharacterized protein n=1 Tax=Chaenocephalus aceratus TaxID=36190 RepID=A0ACB9WYK6_CHAAC|nr:hypothetical protein KUCAC02_004427 [Chaenocephalus aceratus]
MTSKSSLRRVACDLYGLVGSPVVYYNTGDVPYVTVQRCKAPTQSQMRPGSPLQGEEPWRFRRSSLRFLALQHQSANTPPNDVTLLD